MKISVKRTAKRDTYTIGRMYVDGKYYCDTLEDKDRGLRATMELSRIVKEKVYGKTAIPAGEYFCSSFYWPKHRINVVKLHDVPGFSGILIHNGTDENDTLGCIIVGENRLKGKVLNGRRYMVELNDMVAEAMKKGEKVSITIE